MQAAIVTRFCRAVDLRRASHVDEARYFPCLCENYCAMIEQKLYIT